jgi:hypothetical protein
MRCPMLPVLPRWHRREQSQQCSMQSPVSPSLAANDSLDPPERQESNQLKFGCASLGKASLVMFWRC